MKIAILCYNTINIGDEIQSLAMKRLLPKVDYYVTRDNMSIIYDENYNLVNNEILKDTKIHLFINGWFAESDKSRYTPFHFPIPEFITPIFISIYMTSWFISNILDKNIEYFKKYEPIGCRDKNTCEKLLQRGIKAEFVGCVTTTFDNDTDEVNDITYIVDCKTEKDGVKVHHLIYPGDRSLELRFQQAQDLLDKYKVAQKIYTQRLHCYLPCKAMGKDVTFVGKTDDRFGGLINLSDEEYKNMKLKIKNKVSDILNNLNK